MEGLLQPTHLFFILLIVLIIFGPGKLPDLGRGLGKGIKEFKDAMRGGISGGDSNGGASSGTTTSNKPEDRKS
jgi:sec-independent protein translocase protein TatA